MTFLRVTFSFFAILFASQAMAAFEPNIVPVTFDRVYVPDGFDDNDHAQIIGEGFFPNSCYRYAFTKVNVDHGDKIITLKPFAYKYDGICLQMLINFNNPVDLGVLQAGRYNIVRHGDNKSLGHINVRPAKSKDADDYMYAPIAQAFFTPSKGQGKINLTGNFPLSCMKIKEVKVDAQDGILLVQPIAFIDNSMECVEGSYSFKARGDVPSAKPGRYFMHVRTPNNKSINSPIDIP